MERNYKTTSKNYFKQGDVKGMTVKDIEKLAITDTITIAGSKNSLNFKLCGDGNYYHGNDKYKIKLIEVLGDKEVQSIDAFDNEIYIKIK